jgi:FeS assembly SUF system protein
MYMEKIELEQKIVEMIKTVYDPEIPVNIYDLGLIYRIELKEDDSVDIDMTLTAPNCPAADFMMEDVKMKVESIEGISAVNLNLVFEPEWSQDLMTEEANLELGLL